MPVRCVCALTRPGRTILPAQSSTRSACKSRGDAPRNICAMRSSSMRTSDPCKTSPAELMLTTVPCFNNVRTEFKTCHCGTARASPLRSFRLFQLLDEALVDQLLHHRIVVELLGFSRSCFCGGVSLKVTMKLLFQLSQRNFLVNAARLKSSP